MEESICFNTSSADQKSKMSILYEIFNFVTSLDKMGIQSLFVALEPSAKQLHTAASSVGQEFMKSSNLVELFINHCSTILNKDLDQHLFDVNDFKSVEINLKEVSQSNGISIRPSTVSRPDETMALAENQSSLLPLKSSRSQHRCDICDKVFTSEGNLKRHKVILHDNKRVLSCNACGKKFNMLCRLKQHMVVHSEDLTYSCLICSKRFKSSLRLSDHAKIHASLDFSCVQCGKRFTRVKYLKRHMVTHTGKEHLCQVCGKQFTYPKELLRHMVLTHDDPADQLPNYNSENSEIRHEDKSKSRDLLKQIFGQYECTTCRKSFKSKTVLNTHMLVHSGERKFRCDWCGQKFKLKGSLRGHIRTKHTGDRPHVCSTCGRAFAHVYQLKCHRHKHDLYGPNWLPSEALGGGSGGKLTCAQCSKTFTNPVSLWGHMSAHTTRTSLKPFACGHCDKKFARQKSLRRHYRNHHCCSSGSSGVSRGDGGIVLQSSESV